MKKKLIALAIAAALPAAALAQFSESYNFLKAVRDRDGNKVTEIINKPGSGPIIINTRDLGSGETALHIVTRGRDSRWMGFLLAHGAKPDVRDKKGETPLLIAAQIGFVEGANVLLRNKASVDLAGGTGETPLIRAVQKRDSTMVSVLLAGGANPDKTDRGTGLTAKDYARQDTRGGAAILKLLEAPQSKPKPIAGPKL